MRLRFLTLRTTALLLVVSGCGGSPPADVDAGLDAGGDAGQTNDCAGAADGTPCGGGQICLSGACVESTCGDSVVDALTGEQCDDGNDVAFDGCEGDCRFTCSATSDCDDARPCNGSETCGADHRCAAGTPLDPGATCTQTGGGDGVCNGNDCVPAGCGNGVPGVGEDCDDGNTIDGDGCDTDCTFSCQTDPDCVDGDVCNGAETCNTTTHVCATGAAMTCDDSIPCTSNECDPVAGCVFPLIDMDMDGFAPTELGACGTDCNDVRADVNPDATEQCDDTIDQDCDGNVDPTNIPFWYLDCDEDGFAMTGAASQQACQEPAPQSGCGWTTRVPVAGDRTTFDCNDANANVRPSQTSYYTAAISGAPASVDYDYNCNTTEDRQYTATFPSIALRCSGSLGRCSGSSGWTSTTPVCGSSGSYRSCTCAPTDRLCIDGCVYVTATRTQACR